MLHLFSVIILFGNLKFIDLSAKLKALVLRSFEHSRESEAGEALCVKVSNQLSLSNCERIEHNVG